MTEQRRDMRGIVRFLLHKMPHRVAEDVEDELWRPDGSGRLREGNQKGAIFPELGFLKEQA